MNVRPLAALVAFAALSAHAGSGAPALNQARTAVDNPATFDGARDRGIAGPVKAGASTDTRSAEQIAADEQAKADARAAAKAQSQPSLTTAADKAAVAAKPNPWFAKAHIYNGLKGALVGALVGSFGGWVGALIGAGVGFLIAYAISKFTE
ncbi:MAG: hypothetical protein HYZ74_07570 [Elusimicrobia bacterium]|nr:hypothetical protein [Elusimicrobiota bacterium]